MIRFNFRLGDLIHPQEKVREFVRELIQRLSQSGLLYSGPERRREERYRLAIAVNVVPLTDQLQAAGDSFVAITRDISSGGIALIHTDAIDCPYLAVEIDVPKWQKFQATVEILRCRPVGPYFEIAGKFVTKRYTDTK